MKEKRLQCPICGARMTVWETAEASCGGGLTGKKHNFAKMVEVTEKQGVTVPLKSPQTHQD